jgi:hypothetical protein
MNFVKKNFSVVMNLISVLFVIISIGSITSYGLSEGRNTFYKTISFSSKPFNMTIKMYQDEMRLSYTFLNVLFFIGLILLVVSAVNYCKNNKIKGIILIITDVIFSAISFVLFQNGNYLLMTGFVITIFMLQFSLQSNLRNKVYAAITIASSIGLWIINIYFLIKQFTMMVGIADVVGVLLNDLIKISRTNAICLSLFIIPGIISIIENLITE